MHRQGLGISICVIVTLCLITGADYIHAQSSSWRGPTAVPPGNNVPAPINVGSNQQDKAGSLRVGGFRSFGPAIFDGKVGIGTLTPDQALQVVGKFKLVDGSQADGKVLTSDAQGLASWKAISEINTTTINNGGSASRSGTVCGGWWAEGATAPSNPHPSVAYLWGCAQPSTSGLTKWPGNGYAITDDSYISCGSAVQHYTAPVIFSASVDNSRVLHGGGICVYQ